MKLPSIILASSLTLTGIGLCQDLDDVEAEIVEESVEQLPATDAERLEIMREELGAKDTVEGWLVTLPEGVLFEFDKSAVLPGGQEVLDDVADLIELTGEPMITVEGHTDNIGTESYNLDLSLRRAEAVKTYLVAMERLNAYEITAAGLGEQRPIAPNQMSDGSDNPQGRQLNRRVEIHIRKSDLKAEDTGIDTRVVK